MLSVPGTGADIPLGYKRKKQAMKQVQNTPEKNVAILMADLSGYTALTETHGSVSAADLIDKYIRIAERCLVGSSRMHQRTGDEIMFVSDRPDDLLATALKLAANTSREEYFLQVHGGLHTGPVLHRDGSYFGTAINLAARIAAKAAAGSFWCSDDFMQSVSLQPGVRFAPRGRQQFKNLPGETAVFELDIAAARNPIIDPVCRMLILQPEKALRHKAAEEHFFCSAHCLHVYTESRQPASAAGYRH